SFPHANKIRAFLPKAATSRLLFRSASEYRRRDTETERRERNWGNSRTPGDRGAWHPERRRAVRAAGWPDLPSRRLRHRGPRLLWAWRREQCLYLAPSQ